MKNIKRVLLVLLMFITVFGISNVKALGKDIKVTDITVKDKSGTITVVDPTLSGDEVTSNITFNKKDDFVTFELTLKNNESEKYKIESIKDNNTNENIKIEYTFSKDFIPSGNTSKVTIKLSYKNKLINVDKVSLNDLTIKMNLVNEEGKDEEIIINPTTGDNIFHYLVLLIIALTGLIFIITKKTIFKLKIGKLLVLLAVVLVPFAAIAKEQYEVQVKFTNIDIMGEFETYNITIDPKNGSDPVIKQITYGQPIGTLPTNPSKDGYDFEKWVDGNGNEVTSETVITSEISVEAKYNIVEYNITYDLGDGSLPSGKTNPSKYTIESDDITLNNPELAGYTFTGWTGTGIDTQTTSVTIPKGSKDARSYTAHYSANQNTEYIVKHKYAKLTDGYDEEEVTEYGTTGNTVPAPRQPRTGFVTPAEQNVTITGGEKASVTYVYERETYAFSITDRTYIDDTSTANETYPYGTEITIKALERPGYDFAWSDGETNYERTFELIEVTTLTPEYTAKTNTPYVVKHYKQKITLDGYEIEDTQELTGTTDAPISPAVNTYTGFNSPAVQHTTISGEGNTEVIYEYTRKSFTATFNTAGGSDVDSQTIIYGQKVIRPAEDPTKTNATFDNWYTTDGYNTLFDFTNTIIESDTTIYAKFNSTEVTVSFDTNGGSNVSSQTFASGGKATRPAEDPTKDGYVFVNWYTTDEYETVFDFNTTITSDTTIYAKYKKDLFQVVFSEPGECIFNGSGSAISGANCTQADGTKKYIDTGINLYDIANHDKDYEIGFTIVRYDYTEQEEAQSTIMNAKLEGNNYPGVVFRKSNVTNSDYDLSSRNTASGNVRLYFDPSDVETVKIYRIYNEEEDVQEIFYSFNGEPKVKVNDLSQFNPLFKLSVWFGAAPSNLEASSARRYFTGTLSDMYIKLGAYNQDNKYDVSFNTNGGSSIDSQIVTSGGTATRPVYIPYKEGYEFVDWYADSELTTLYDFTTPITDDTIIYAKYVENQFPLVFTHDGECTFNGSNGVLEGDDCAFANGYNKYIDTLVQLYNTDNLDKDYEIGFTIESYDPDEQEVSQATLMNTKSEGTNYPGVVFRRRGTSQEFDLSSRRTSSANSALYFDSSTVNYVKIYRIYNEENDVQEIFYSIDGAPKVKVNDLSAFNPEFDLSVWFGAAPKNASATDAQRYLKGTLSNMYIKLGTYQEGESTTYTVKLNANGGTVSPTSITKDKGVAVGELPTPTAPTGKTFAGWYTGISTGIQVDSSYMPNSNVTIYARYNDIQYTVAFDTDGGSEVASQTISHGGKVTRPSTDPTKEGYDFDDWYTTNQYTTKFDFTNTTITSAITIYAKFDSSCKTFSTDSWSTIKTNLETNSNYYPVGCEKTVELDMDNDYTPETYIVRLVNTSTPEVCSNEGYSQTSCGLVIEFLNRVTSKAMKSSEPYTNEGGWKETELVTYLNTEFYNKLPSDLRSIIIPTYPIVSGSGQSGISDDILATDINKNKIYLLSSREVGFDDSGDNKNNVLTDTRTLDYYIGSAPSGEEIKREKYTRTNVRIGWWLRNALITNATAFGGVYPTGTKYGDSCFTLHGITPAFRIGTMPEFTVTFDTDGGSAVVSQTITYGENASKPLNNPIKSGYTFDDWYTDDTYTTKFDFTKPITSAITIYAKFEELQVCTNNENITRLSENTCSANENITVGEGIVCKRAVKLHEETCSQTDGTFYCSGAGYTNSGSKGTTTITYGSCGTSGSLTSGDAFTCDVNGDGDFDELTERFYYVSDYYDTTNKIFDNSTAVLIYYNNVTSGVSCNNNKYAYDLQNNYNGPRTLALQLPTTIQWNNVSLKNTPRQILDAEGNNIIVDHNISYNLPIFDYSKYAARFLTTQELNSACDTTIGNMMTGELDKCNYMMENTKYANSSIVNYGPWLETPFSSSTEWNRVWSVFSNVRYVYNYGVSLSDSNGARPVIEIPKSAIAYGSSTTYYTVKFNANGGNVTQNYITVESGNSVSTLPTPTAPDGKEFVGWYTGMSDGIKIDETYTPSSNITVYAKYRIPDLCNGFSTDSWSTITNNIENNSSYYPIGCEKEIEMDMTNDGIMELYTVRVSNTSTPDICSTSGFSQTACGIVIEFVDVIEKNKYNTYNVNSTDEFNGNKSGWEHSFIRDYLNTTIYDKLPSDLKDVIIDTTVVSGYGKENSSNYTTNDKIYLLTTHEIWEDVYEGNWGLKVLDTAYYNTRQLDYYNINGVTTSYNGNSKLNVNPEFAIKKYRENITDWILRTPCNVTDIKYVYCVNSAGGNGEYGSVSSNMGIAPAFRIGTNQ